MTESCDNCKWYEQGLNPCDWCSGASRWEPVEPEKKKTNFDNIKAMTVEKMAEFLFIKVSPCPDQEHISRCGMFFGCEDCWVDWLKQEYES